MNEPLPKDWSRRKIQEFATVSNGTTPSRNVSEYWCGEYPWLSTTKVNDRTITFADEFITQKALDECALRVLPTETILIAMIGQGKTRGKAAFLGIDATVNQNFAAIVPDETIHNKYLFFLLESSYHRLRNLSQGSNQGSLNCKIISDILVSSPPLPEQKKIAEILSTWDEAIDLTQQLIDAKQKRKKGLMQKLLTGKVRFPGFEDEWESIKAGELFASVSIKKNEDEELLSVTQDLGAIPRMMVEGRVMSPSGSTSGYKLVIPGNFIISLRSFQGGLEYSEYRGLVSPAYTVLEPKKKIVDNYYRYFFKSYEFIGRLAIAVIGIRDGKQISYSDFCTLRLPYPPFSEQQKIAEVLSACDEEISLLQQKLQALQKQKKGLMQQLLTGKTRVKV